MGTIRMFVIFLDCVMLMTMQSSGLVIRARVRKQGKDVANPRLYRPDFAVIGLAVQYHLTGMLPHLQGGINGQQIYTNTDNTQSRPHVSDSPLLPAS